MYDGRPMMAFGGFGGDKIPQATLQIFLNAVEFGFDPQAAVEAPRVYSFNFPNSANPPIYLPGVLRVERRLSDAVITALVERGHDIELLPEWWEGACLYGLIRRDSISGLLQAGADPRGEAFAMAY
jgi:gamma-glutamyltranspeptidase/glutathione hydrolase